MNRPFDLEWLDPVTLAPNAANYRRHGDAQRAAFVGVLGEVGWSDALLYNRRSAVLLDGHMRREEAIRAGVAEVPVIVGDWDDATAAKILASRDTLGMMAEIDAVAWTELLRDVETATPELAALFSDLSESLGEIPGIQDTDGASPTGDTAAGGDADEASPPPDARQTPDIVWPSSNRWGVPDLDPRWQAIGPTHPMTAWGSVSRRKAMGGTWLLYVDDKRFEPLWDDPAAILLSGPSAAVEPNFSTHPQMPWACVLWQTYRKRWINRFLQANGIRTFVDLNVGDESHRELNFAGVPAEWRAFATRSHDGGTNIEADFAAAAAFAGTDDLRFLVYGGGAAVREMCQRRGWFWCPEQSDEARGRALPPLGGES